MLWDVASHGESRFQVNSSWTNYDGKTWLGSKVAGGPVTCCQGKLRAAIHGLVERRCGDLCLDPKGFDHGSAHLQVPNDTKHVQRIGYWCARALLIIDFQWLSQPFQKTHEFSQVPRSRFFQWLWSSHYPTISSRDGRDICSWWSLTAAIAENPWAVLECVKLHHMPEANVHHIQGILIMSSLNTFCMHIYIYISYL